MKPKSLNFRISKFQNSRIEFFGGILCRILLVVFLIPLSNTFPQIPINGFCKFNSYIVEPSYTKIFALNFNNDSYNDLILFNPALKTILSLTGDPNGNFSQKKVFELPIEISRLQTLFDSKHNVIGYAFTSRKGLTAGIMNFSKDGKASLLKKIKFQSYPENISVSDIDRDGEPEILISGSAFNGLSYLSQLKKEIKENKIVENESYKDAIFMELTNDGLKDIAAFNLFTNSLEFFHNKKGEFRKVRSIEMNEKINSLKAFNINLDFYEDLLFSKGNSIIIMYGDFKSSYSETKTLLTKFFPDNFITGDFNKDGKIDIAYLNSSEGILSIFFGKNEKEFYPEIVYLRKKGLREIIPFYSKFINAISGINEEGELCTIRRVGAISDDISLSLGVEPGAITFFDNDNDGIVDISFIDNYDASLKIILRNNSGVPALLYSVPMFENHNEILVDNPATAGHSNESGSSRTFYCFSYGKKLIEKIKIDPDNYRDKIERNSFYTDGEIEDLRIGSVNIEEPKIYAAYSKKNNLGVNIFQYRELKYEKKNYPKITDNLMAANIELSPSLNIYYWKKQNNSASLFSTELNPDKMGSQPKEIIKIDLPKDYYLTTFAGDLFNKEKEIVMSFFEPNVHQTTTDSILENAFVVIASNQFLYIKPDKPGKNPSDQIKVKDRNQLFFGETRFNGLKKLFFLDPEEKSIKRIGFIDGGKNFITTLIKDSVEIKRYFIKNMNFKNYHLVYTDVSSGCINIKKI